jgi:hypothetical protein
MQLRSSMAALINKISYGSKLFQIIRHHKRCLTLAIHVKYGALFYPTQQVIIHPSVSNSNIGLQLLSLAFWFY